MPTPNNNAVKTKDYQNKQTRFISEHLQYIKCDVHPMLRWKYQNWKIQGVYSTSKSIQIINLCLGTTVTQNYNTFNQFHILLIVARSGT